MLKSRKVPGKRTREMTSIFLARNWKLLIHSNKRLRLLTGISLWSRAEGGIIGEPSIRRISGSYKGRKNSLDLVPRALKRCHRGKRKNKRIWPQILVQDLHKRKVCCSQQSNKKFLFLPSRATLRKNPESLFRSFAALPSYPIFSQLLEPRACLAKRMKLVLGSWLHTIFKGFGNIARGGHRR